MKNLFTQLYIRMTIVLVITIFLILSLLTFLVDQRYEAYVLKNVAPMGNLVSASWQLQQPENQVSWLELVSSLTNTSWQANPITLLKPIQVVESSWATQTADINVRLNNQLTVNVNVSNWRDLYIGFGWLLLNDISLQPSESRQAYFEQLQLQLPWQLLRVNRGDESLSALSIRQLKAGQAIFLPTKDHASDWLYLPAGAEQVIKIGPIVRFEAFSNPQWFGVLAAALTILAIALTLITRPIYNRIEAIRKGLDRFSRSKQFIKLPTEYTDSLGSMALNIENMANDLIKEIDHNQQLNIAVSHDLKTPLARLKFSLRMIQERGAHDYLEHMNRDLDQLTNLVNELLLYHQLSATSQTNIEPQNIAIALQNQVKESRQKDFDIHLTTSHTEVNYPIEPTHWYRLSQNLIDNAMQYGHKRMSVYLGLTKNDLELSVSDDGLGLSPNEFQNFLLPFQRTDSSPKTHGPHHGLGLSLVQAVCAHYGGHLTLGSSALGGSCIIVKLPLKRESSS